jgi:hypothetical protein
MKQPEAAETAHTAAGGIRLGTVSVKNIKRKGIVAMKKPFLQALCLLAALTAAAAIHGQTAPDGIRYERNGGGVTVIRYAGKAAALVIPPEISGLPVTSIRLGAFSGCTDLTSVSIPASVTSIGAYAFSGCTGLTGVSIPPSVTSIGDGAFSGCTGLASVSIPASVTSIGDGAFSGCTGLASVSIPPSVTSIGQGAFSGCTDLTGITVDQRNTAYVSVDGVLFTKDQKTLAAYPGGKKGAYSIPASVTEIGQSTFADCASLTSVTIPNSVTAIGWYAFSGCTSLTSVTLSRRTKVGNGAFHQGVRIIYSD